MYVRICDSQTWRSESVAVLPFAVDFYIFLAPDAVRAWRFCTFPKHRVLLSILPGDEQIHIHIGKPCRSSACLVRIAGPCPAVPFQLVPVQPMHTNVRAYECTSMRIATEARAYSQQIHSR